MTSRPWIVKLLVAGMMFLYVFTVLLILASGWESSSAPAFAFGLWFPTVMILYLIVGMLIVLRHPDNVVGWLLLVFGGASLLSTSGRAYASIGALPAASVGVWMSKWTELMSIGFLWLAILHFPDGRLASPRWRWVQLALVVSIGLVGVVAVLLWPHRRDPVLLMLFVENIDFGAATVLLWIAQRVLFLSGAAAAVSVLFRFQRASSVVRQQIKWLLFAASIGITGSISLLLAGAGPDSPDAPFIGVLLAGLGLTGVPIAIGIAILRYRLYDIDIVIRKTLIYSLLTALLALIYFGAVVLLQRVLGAVTGIGQSTLAVVVSTLLIAALFTPLRARIHGWIDRRFYRKRYDAQQVLAQFAHTARDETDMDALAAELERVVNETLQPERASVWICDRAVTTIVTLIASRR